MRVKVLESKKNPRVVFYRKLDNREFRESSGFMAAEGIRLVTEALRSGLAVPEIFLSESLGETPAATLIESAGNRPGGGKTAVYRLPEVVFHSMAHTQHPQGAAATVSLPLRGAFTAALRELDRVVVLYHPQDPGNVGTVLRSVEAAGFRALVIIEPACNPFNPKAVRASMGSVFRLPVWSLPSFEEAAGHLSARGFKLFAAKPRAVVSLYELTVDPGSPMAVIFGGETAGLPDESGMSMNAFSIPMAGEVESLNLAQAVTVVLYEIMRREIAARRARYYA